MCEIKNTLSRINNRLEIAEEKISEFECIVIETIQMKHKERTFKNWTEYW